MYSLLETLSFIINIIDKIDSAAIALWAIESILNPAVSPERGALY